MTTLKFPDASESWEDAFNNALERGVFSNDPSSQSFWCFYELQASEIENGQVVADWFHQKYNLKFERIPRTEKDI